MKQDVCVEFNKRNMWFILLASVVFQVIGAFLIINVYGFKISLLNNSTFELLLGLVCFVFFSLCSWLIYRKLKSKELALWISSEGLEDNASGVSAGFIAWSEVKGFKTFGINQERFIAVLLHSPDDYIDLVQNPIKKMTIKMNYKLYGSPVTIPEKMLKIDFDELVQLLQDRLLDYQSQA